MLGKTLHYVKSPSPRLSMCESNTQAAPGFMLSAPSVPVRTFTEYGLELLTEPDPERWTRGYPIDPNGGRLGTRHVGSWSMGTSCTRRWCWAHREADSGWITFFLGNLIPFNP